MDFSSFVAQSFVDMLKKNGLALQKEGQHATKNNPGRGLGDSYTFSIGL